MQEPLVKSPVPTRKASLFLLLGFLWSVGGYGTFTLSEGLFLEHVGASHLPQTYIFIALGLCFLSFIMIKGLSRIPIRRLLVTLILFWAGTNFLLASFLPIGDTLFFWFLFKVIGWIMPLSIFMAFWAFIDQYYDLQDAKKYFYLFNSITLLGDAVGAGLISYLLKALSPSLLLALFGGLIAFAMPIVWVITKKVSPLIEEHHDHVDSTSNISFTTTTQSLFKSRFTLILLLFYFAMQLIGVVTEYNYMSSFQQAFVTSPPNHLTEFMGRCGMWVSLANMTLGLLLYRPLVKRLGINNLAVLSPSLFLLLFSLWFFKGGLVFAIFGMLTREIVLYSLDDNNLTLLVSAVPSKIKNQIRFIVESFFEPVGMLFAAWLLLVFQKNSMGLGIIISLIATLLVFYLRASYHKALFENLLSSSIRFGKKAIDWIPVKERRQAEFLLLRNLKQHDEKSQLLALEYLLKMGNDKLLPRLLNRINRLSIPSKVKAIYLLSESRFATRAQVAERLEWWRRSHAHPRMRSAIHFFFARHGMIRPEKVIHDLHNPHLGLRAAAILTLKTSPASTSLPTYTTLADKKLKELLNSKIEQETALGLEILGLDQEKNNFEKALPYLKNPSLSIKRAAATALLRQASTQHKHFAALLISRLPLVRDSKIRRDMLHTLETIVDSSSCKHLILSALHFRPHERKLIETIIYGRGNEVIAPLSDMMKDRGIAVRSRLLAAKVVAKLDPTLFKKSISNLLQKEIYEAYCYYYHSQTVQQQLPEHDLYILKNALTTTYHSLVDFMIQLLGLSGRIEESEVIAHSLWGKNQRLRGQAIETIQKACHPKLFAQIEPLINESKREEKLRYFLRKQGIPLSLPQLLDKMADSASLSNQIVSMGLKTRLRIPGWKEMLLQRLTSQEEIFSHFAQEMLTSYETL